MSKLRGVYLLSPAHAEGLRALASDADFAAAAAMSEALSDEGIAAYVAAAVKAREEGRSYVFVLTRGVDVLGVCRLIGVLGVPRLIVAIGREYRGQGNGSYIVRHVLEFAFEQLRVERVTAGGACLRLVARFGLLSNGKELTRQAWQDARRKTERLPRE